MTSSVISFAYFKHFCVGEAHIYFTLNHVIERNFKVRLFKKIQDWTLKFERMRKLMSRFFTKQINPRFVGSWCVKSSKEPKSGFFSSFGAPRSERSWIDLSSKETQNPFSDLTIQSWIFLKKRA